MEDYLSLRYMKIATSPGKYFILHNAVMNGDGDATKI